jgi:hypothetical protein
MNVRTLMLIGFAALTPQAALAQTPAPAAPAAPTGPTSSQASIDGIMAQGYEIKAVTVLSDAAAKEVFGSAPSTSQIFITLQKGTSIAVCENATSTWLSLSDAQMTDATRCFKR